MLASVCVCPSDDDDVSEDMCMTRRKRARNLFEGEDEDREGRVRGREGRMRRKDEGDLLRCPGDDDESGDVSRS